MIENAILFSLVTTNVSRLKIASAIFIACWKKDVFFIYRGFTWEDKGKTCG